MRLWLAGPEWPRYNLRAEPSPKRPARQVRLLASIVPKREHSGPCTTTGSFSRGSLPFCASSPVFLNAPTWLLPPCASSSFCPHPVRKAGRQADRLGPGSRYPSLIVKQSEPCRSTSMPRSNASDGRWRLCDGTRRGPPPKILQLFRYVPRSCMSPYPAAREFRVQIAVVSSTGRPWIPIKMRQPSPYVADARLIACPHAGT
ncbi:hypothetical protein MAPG_01953 [Magnaporthiopsis poae ATCC 64411]|uniref:Uncharacterized protein n=1 Tax=Magnaporthiopsis poae (strain ATCC 64411 / 73-15) TaxID=644358 RepID=A0A0C4DQ18_MAGP6|nr:hypothetical protein MAPG_01953 [Magnaporthiopsis poae ATCC 64411]